MRQISVFAAASAVAVCGAVGAARGDQAAVAAFYKDRQISDICYSRAGSAYDVYARLLNRHMGRHLPGKPSFVARNMPGAGGLKLMEYLYSIAPQDGTVMGAISRGNPFEPMLGNKKAKFDPFKFTWLGSMNKEVSLAISWHTAKVKTFADLKTTELLIPGTGAGADSQILPVAFNKLAGTRFKIILGYSSTTTAALNMEQGELDGIGYWSWSAITSGHPDWLRDKKINLLLHTGVTEHPELKGVARIREEVKDETDRKALEFILAREIIGRPFVATPGIPAERAKALQTAFSATFKDPRFVADARKSRLDVDPLSGPEMEAFLRQIAATPKPVIARVKDVLSQK